MIQQPLVSVLVPSYNHGAYLIERIESIFAQTYPNFELFVIDDNSQDNSATLILRLQLKYSFKYIHNKRNSGTPFSAWERICELANGKYIWVCESDDVADNNFLELAINRLEANPKAVLFYSNSLIINEKSEVVGHTDSYFKDVWGDTRWEHDFSANGNDELLNFQLRGQTVPNMSSALIRTSAFKNAFSSFLKRFRLTGDWLFVGAVLREGDVEFSNAALNRFRKHEITSRAKVNSARSQAEFILTKFHLFLISGLGVNELAPLMASDAQRFLYESARWWEVVRALIQISLSDTIQCVILFLLSVIKHPNYLKKFNQRFNHAKAWRKKNVQPN